MNKVGVPVTPLRTPERRSALARSAWVPATNSRPNRSCPGPAAAAAKQIFQLEGILVGEQVVVHLPELVLCASGFGGLSGQEGVRVGFQQGEMPQGQAHGSTQLPLQLLQQRVGARAKRALEVDVFDQRHRGPGITTDVILRTWWIGQRAHTIRSRRVASRRGPAHPGRIRLAPLGRALSLTLSGPLAPTQPEDSSQVESLPLPPSPRRRGEGTGE